jgi:predicted nucleic acid-binding protein
MVSAALRPGSVPEQAVRTAFRRGEVCASVETLDELAQVLERGKFERYRDIESRRAFAAVIRRGAHLFAA